MAMTLDREYVLFTKALYTNDELTEDEPIINIDRLKSLHGLHRLIESRLAELAKQQENDTDETNDNQI